MCFYYVIITSSDLVLELGQFGWTMWSALGLRISSTSVPITILDRATVAMAKMLESSANVS